MNSIVRKSLLYKTAVEYGDYTINHVEGCSHGCLYPCYAMMMAKRFGKVKSYSDWIKPKIVENAIELLEKEIPKYKKKIKFVHMCFSTDPFMYKCNEVKDLTYKLIKILNKAGIRCTALTKGMLPLKLAELSEENEFGITLISLDEKFREEYEPYSATYVKRIESLYNLYRKGIKTWVSIEPYPTPNILEQDFDEILERIGFVDRVIFGKLNYNKKASKYEEKYEFYSELSSKVIDFCNKNGKEYHIKDGTPDSPTASQSSRHSKIDQSIIIQKTAIESRMFEYR